MAAKPPAARSAFLDDADDVDAAVVAAVAAVRRADKKAAWRLPTRVAKRIEFTIMVGTNDSCCEYCSEAR